MVPSERGSTGKQSGSNANGSETGVASLASLADGPVNPNPNGSGSKRSPVVDAFSGVNDSSNERVVFVFVSLKDTTQSTASATSERTISRVS